MSSSVNNPYTFNIKSNCEFSTDPIISNNAHRAKLTMVYSYDDTALIGQLTYGTAVADSSIEPTVINGVNIGGIVLSFDFGKGRLQCSLNTSGKKYSKIILNGGIFYNLEVPYQMSITSKIIYYYYSGDPVNSDGIPITDPTHWKDYDKTPFDFTMEFVE